MLIVAITSSWAADAAYVPQGVKTITANETVYCTSITEAGDPATSWVVVPNYGTSSLKYTNTNGDTKGNPDGIEDNIVTTSANVNMIQIKADGNTFTSKNRVVHMHVKGITGVIGHGATSSSNRGMAIACTEYVAGSTTTIAAASATVTRPSNSGSFICQVTGLDATKEYIVSFYAVSNDTRFYCAEFIAETATTAPTITTDLPATAEVTVGVATEFSIEATGAASYQWYVGGEAVEGATSATYSYTAAAAGDVEIYCNAINSIGATKSTVCTVTATAPASIPSITTDLEDAYNVIKGKTLDLSIVAEGAASYQWYLDNEPVEGATSASYTFTAGSTMGVTNEIYCAATNAAGTANSTVATVTTVGRADCELINIQFSNGAWGAINSGAYGDKTIAVPYTAGTTAPTVEISSIVVSEGATYVLDGNTLTVTAEDGTTNKAFTITAVEITPLDVTADVAESFTAVPSWVFNLYGYDDSKGLKFAKAVNDGTGMRIALGNTRQYYFISAAKSLTLTKTGTARKVNVYVNGTKVLSDTSNDALGAIELDETASNLVIIEAAAGTSGDGGFSAYAIEAAAKTQNIAVGQTGFATIGLPFATTVPEGVTAYGITAIATSKATASEAILAGTTIPGNKGYIIVAAPGNYTFTEVESAEDDGANVLAATGATAKTATTDGEFYYFTVLDSANKKVGFKKIAANGTVAAYKAYLPAGINAPATLSIDFSGDATAVDSVAEAAEAQAAPVKVITSKGIQIGNYNIAGQQVK